MEQYHAQVRRVTKTGAIVQGIFFSMLVGTIVYIAIEWWALPLLVRILMVPFGLGFSSWYTMRIVRSDAVVVLLANEIRFDVFCWRIFGPGPFVVNKRSIKSILPGGSHGSYNVEITTSDAKFDIKPLSSNSGDRDNFDELMTKIGKVYGYD